MYVLFLQQIQRKWRQKEIEIVKNKIQDAQELRNIRQRQISDIRKYQTIRVCEKKEEAEKINDDNSKLKEELELSKTKQKEVGTKRGKLSDRVFRLHFSTSFERYFYSRRKKIFTPLFSR